MLYREEEGVLSILGDFRIIGVWSSIGKFWMVVFFVKFIFVFCFILMNIFWIDGSIYRRLEMGSAF